MRRSLTQTLVLAAAVVGALALPAGASAQARPRGPAAPPAAAGKPGTPAKKASTETTPTPGKPSETMDRAMKLAKRADSLWQAAVDLEQVMIGKTGDDEGNKQLAAFELAAVYYKLHLHQACYEILSGIAENPAHLRFSSALNYLFKLAKEMAEPAEVVERLGKYEADIEKFNKPEHKADYQELAFLYGKYLYRHKDYAKATTFFSRVGRDSKFYVKANFFQGISFVQLFKRKDALEAFTKVLGAVAEGLEMEEPSRMADLAHLSLARLEYSSAFMPDGRSIEARIDEAERHWNKVEPSSEYWLDALFEEGWAYTMKEDYARALGNIHAIQAPYFPDAYFPEAEILKAYIYLESCQHENARIVVARFRQKYDPVNKELGALIDKLKKENETARPSDGKEEDSGQEGAFFRFLVRVRDGKETLPTNIAYIVRKTLGDRELLRHLEYVKDIDAERARFKKEAPASFKTSGAGEQVRDSIKTARGVAVRNADDFIRKQFETLLDELRDQITKSDEMRHDILQEERNEMMAKAAGAKREAALVEATKLVEVDDEHVIWPFDGEYWRDELGFYRQKISTCRSQK